MTLTNNILSKGIGMNRPEHILNILNDKTISKQWLERYRDYPDEFDVKVLFNACCAHELQYEHSEKMIDILPETRECIDYLGFNYIKTGCTTDFSKENMELIQNKLELNDIYLDNYVSSTCLDKPGRPHKFMIQENMKRLGISNPREVLKIDDTVVGIEEGKNAGCITVGVARWSIHMNIMSISDAYEFDEKYPEIQDRLKHSRSILREAGADYVIDTLDELPLVIESINYK
jgi:phosphonoacetaldehyde hydrolase